ncbi:A1 cistron-splicing factor [Poronia punctata]|nr:A1 cistron-splicing factor [Poronia punctata]
MDDGKPDLRRGDIFILDGLPGSFTVGCDPLSFSSSRPFLGFRDITPGAHLIWVAPQECTSSRTGCWFYTEEKSDDEPGRVRVKQWDKFNEVLGEPASQDEDEDEDEERFEEEKLERMFEKLVPYGPRRFGREEDQIIATAEAKKSMTNTAVQGSQLIEKYNMWYQLTSEIRPSVLKKIMGQSRGTYLVTTMDSVAGQSDLSGESRLYSSGTSHLRFTFPMDVRLISPEATGAERTRQALDPTAWVISKLENPDDNDLVGEFQFAFITGMHLGNQPCLEQWFFLLTQLILRCYDLPLHRPRLARSLIQTFHAQLLYNDAYLEGDVFDLLSGSSERSLRIALTKYKARLDEKFGDLTTDDQSTVSLAFSSLESYVQTKRGWDIQGNYVKTGNMTLEDGEVVQLDLPDFEDDDETGEYAPVVLTLDTP